MIPMADVAQPVPGPVDWRVSRNGHRPGFRGTKYREGDQEDPAEDLERIAAVREIIGPHRTLMVDAIECFTQAEAPIRRAAMREQLDLYPL